MAEGKFWKKFASRKFLSAILGAVIGVAGKSLGIPQIAVSWVLGILGTYIAGESAVDIARVNHLTKE